MIIKMSSRNSKYYAKSIKKTSPQASLFQFGVTSSRTPSANERVSDSPPLKVAKLSDLECPGPSDGANTESPDTALLNDDASQEMPLYTASKFVPVESENETRVATEATDNDQLSQCSSSDYNTTASSSASMFTETEDFEEESAKPSPYNLDSRKKNPLKYELQFAWLYHSARKNGYICKYCELFGDTSSKTETAFSKTGAVLGTHPTRRLVTHAESRRHKLSLQRYADMNNSQFLDVKSYYSKDVSIQNNRSHVKKLFRMTRFLIKKKWGYTENVKDLAHLVADLGDSKMAAFLKEDINYLSPTSVTEIVESMSTFYKKKTIDDMKDQAFTLLLDESTDNANRSQASMARWVGNDGYLKEEFIDLVHLKGCKAIDFLEAVQLFCNSFGLKTENLRFIALDGCNTMSGERTGLQRRVRNLALHSLYVGCRNHKLALCFVHLVKKRGLLREVEEVFISIWKLFHFSSKRNTVFKDMQEIYGDRPLSFVKASGTRWLSHLRASERFVLRYQAILDTLDTLIQDTKEPELEGIRAKSTNLEVVFTILLLTDVLKPVNFLSLYLQEDQGFFTSLSERVKACVQDLHNIIEVYQS